VKILRSIPIILIIGGLFYVLWSGVLEPEEWKLPQSAEIIKTKVSEAQLVKEGEKTFKMFCTACHSVRYKEIYPTFVNAPNAKPLFKLLMKKNNGFLNRYIYESAFALQLKGLKAAFGSVPPDLSTAYVYMGEGKLFNFIKDPQKVLPGTKMPNMHLSDRQVVAISTFLKTAILPTEKETQKRHLIGTFVIIFLIVLAVLFALYRKAVLTEEGIED